jgi:hypothetical protein
MESLPALELATAMLKQASQPGGLDSSLKAATEVRHTVDLVASQSRHQTGETTRQNAEWSFDRPSGEQHAPPGLGQFVDLTV